MVIGYLYTDMNIKNGHIRFSFNNLHSHGMMINQERLDHFMNYFTDGTHEVDLSNICAKRQLIW